MKVVLTGDGGDELFAGYEGYKNNNYLSQQFPSIIKILYQCCYAVEKICRSENIRIMQLLAGFLRRQGSEGRRYSEQVAQSSLFAMSAILTSDVFFTGIEAWQNNLLAFYYDSLDTEDKLLRKLYAEFKTRLVDEMLMKVDRMTMAHGLEARVPLLDHQLVEFAFQIPSDLKLRKNHHQSIGKYIFKKTMEQYLPKNIIYRDKKGFNIPIKYWMRGDFLKKIKPTIFDGSLVKYNIINKNNLEKLYQKQLEGKQDFSNLILLLYSFETWVNIYTSKFGNILFI